MRICYEILQTKYLIKVIWSHNVNKQKEKSKNFSKNGTKKPEKNKPKPSKIRKKQQNDY